MQACPSPRPRKVCQQPVPRWRLPQLSSTGWPGPQEANGGAPKPMAVPPSQATARDMLQRPIFDRLRVPCAAQGRASDLHDLEPLASHRERLLTPRAETSRRHHWRSLPETLRIPQNWDAPGAPRWNVNYRGLDEGLFVRRLLPFPPHKRRFQSLHPDDARMPPTT